MATKNQFNIESQTLKNLERTVEGAWTHGLLPDVQVDTSKAELEALRQFLASYSPPKSALAGWRPWL